MLLVPLLLVFGCCVAQQSVTRLPASSASCVPVVGSLACPVAHPTQLGMNNWANADRAIGLGQFAESPNLDTTGETSSWLIGSDFRFASIVPTSATILGLEVVIDISSTSSNQLRIENSNVRLVANNIMFLSTSQLQNVPVNNARANLTLGGPNDLWTSVGFSLPGMWTQSNFGIALAVSYAAGGPNPNRARVFGIYGRLFFLSGSTVSSTTVAAAQSTLASAATSSSAVVGQVTFPPGAGGTSAATSGAFSSATSSSGSQTDNVGIIVGAVVGGLMLIALIVVVAALAVRSRKRKELMEPLIQSADYESQGMGLSNTSEVNSSDMNSLAFALEAPLFKSK